MKIYSFYTSDMKAKLFQPWVLEQISPDGLDASEALVVCTPTLRIGPADPDAVHRHASQSAGRLAHGWRQDIDGELPRGTCSLPGLSMVEFVEKLPSSLKLRGFKAKYLHKKAVEKWLPRKVIDQKKKGFANPVYNWLRDSMHQYVSDCLLSDNAAVGRYFDQSYIRRLVADHEAGRQNYHAAHLPANLIRAVASDVYSGVVNFRPSGQDGHLKILDLSIVIINWNSAAFVRKCLQSVYSGATAMRVRSHRGRQRVLR